MQVWIVVIEVFDRLRPLRIFMYVIQKKVRSTLFDKSVSRIKKAVFRKPQIVQGYIEDLAQIGAECTFDMLQHECGFSYTSCSPYADKTCFPLNGGRYATDKLFLGMRDFASELFYKPFHTWNILPFLKLYTVAINIIDDMVAGVTK